MGWKSSTNISRDEAVMLIIEKTMDASNFQLAQMLADLGFGDDMDLPYFGYSVQVVDDQFVDNQDDGEDTGEDDERFNL